MFRSQIGLRTPLSFHFLSLWLLSHVCDFSIELSVHSVRHLTISSYLSLRLITSLLNPSLSVFGVPLCVSVLPGSFCLVRVCTVTLCLPLWVSWAPSASLFSQPLCASARLCVACCNLSTRSLGVST